jgi:YVTN family beta-propeller protein
MGGLPRAVQIDPDGIHAYVTSLGSHCVTAIDAITNTIEATVEVGGHPEALAVSPDGRWLYVGDYWFGALTIITAPSITDHHRPKAAPSCGADSREPLQR